MTTEDLFGDSQLLTEFPPDSSQGAVPPTRSGNGDMLEGWSGHLACVDEPLMLRVWRRLLADEDAVNDLLNDDFLKELHPAIQERRQVPVDTNSSFLAHALMECSDGNRSVPLSELITESDARLVRVLGSLSTVRAVPNGWTLRIAVAEGESCLVRFGHESFLGRRQRLPLRAGVLVLAIVDDARKRELSGIALLVRKSV